MAVLDTSYLIALSHKVPAAIRMQQRLEEGGDPLMVAAVSWMEFLAGIPDDRRAAAATLLGKAARLVPFEREAAEVAARIQHSLLVKGRRRGWNDLQVAATALVSGQPVVTMDRDFSGIPGLEVLKP